jgi:mannose-1-phosphate guanylyltransferase
MDYAVIMAGGSGKRLWPLSRRNRPKQIIKLFQDQSLLELCVNRTLGVFAPENILVITNREYADVVRQHLPHLPPENIIGEPVGRDTANAIGLAGVLLNLRDPDAAMAVFSADQIIEPVEPLHQAVHLGLRFLKKKPDALFTFGIKAAYAHTGYGYLKQGEPSGEDEDGVFPVESFEEKPNRNTASAYIRSGNYCWNSGMFVWKIKTILKYLEEFLPHNFERLQTIAEAWHGPHRDDILNAEFELLEKISIDFGVMEKAPQVHMCRLDCHWMDVGSFHVLAETGGEADDQGNITPPETLTQWINANNNIVISDDKKHLVAAVNVDDLIIVHTEDATLICHRDETDRLKTLIDQLSENDLQEYV